MPNIEAEPAFNAGTPSMPAKNRYINGSDPEDYFFKVN
jgi:hypothetical protein